MYHGLVTPAFACGAMFEASAGSKTCTNQNTPQNIMAWFGWCKFYFLLKPQTPHRRFIRFFHFGKK